MKERILKSIVNEVCDDFITTICASFEEYPDDFPYTTACVNFLFELKEKGIFFNFKKLTQCNDLLDNIYCELIKYLEKGN